MSNHLEFLGTTVAFSDPVLEDSSLLRESNTVDDTVVLSFGMSSLVLLDASTIVALSRSLILFLLRVFVYLPVVNMTMMLLRKTIAHDTYPPMIRLSEFVLSSYCEICVRSVEPTFAIVALYAQCNSKTATGLFSWIFRDYK